MEKIDRLLKRIQNWFTKDKRIVFLTTFIAGIFIHFQVITHDLVAFDGYWHYGSFLAKGWEITLGRFMIPFADLFRGTVVTSILTTTISIAILSLTTLFLCEVLKIKKTFLKVLVGLLLVSAPTFSLTLMYAYTADSYTWALFFSVLTIYFLNQSNNKGRIFAMISIVITLGFYQSYLCVTATLFIICQILKLLQEKIEPKVFFEQMIQDLITLLLGIILYYFVLTLIITLLHLDITSYSGGNQIASVETIKNILPSIKNTYLRFYEFFFTDNIVTNPTLLGKKIINGIVLLTILINFILLIIQDKNNRKPWKIVTLLVMIALYPVASCSIELIAQNRQMNLLMSESLYLIFTLLISEINLFKKEKVFNDLSFILILLSIWTFTLSDNATYTARHLYNEQMYALGNRIVMKLSEDETLPSDLPIAVLGNLNFQVHNDQLLQLTNFDVSDVKIWTWQIFLEDHLGVGRTIYTGEEYNGIFDNTEYLEMNVFPKEGSIKMIDDTIIVKISN